MSTPDVVLERAVLPPARPRRSGGWATTHIKGDLAGGFIAAVISVAESIPYGLLVFAPLGAAYAAQGSLAGLYASIFGALIATICGGTPLLISGPRASTVVILAAIMARLAAAPDLEAHGGVATAIALAGVALAAAGALVALFGLLRLGRIIKFVPYPVIAGFMNGVAFLILITQAKAILGLPADFTWAQWRDLTALWHPLTAVVAIATFIGVAAGPRLTRLAPALVIGIGFGIAAHYLLAAALGADAVGPVIGDLPGAAPSVFALAPAFEVLGTPWAWARLIDIAPLIAVLAVVAAVDSLMGAAALDSLTHQRHRSNRELLGQGLANMGAAVMGGIGVSGAVSRSAASFRAGARTRWAGVAHGAAVLCATLALGPMIGAIPRVVLAAVLVAVAVGMIDTWSRELLSRLKAEGGYRGEIMANLAVVVLVAVVAISTDLITAVAVGVLISMVLFVQQMSKPIVRQVTDARRRRSLKVRERMDAELLSRRGDEVVIIELDGPLFFGTADALLGEVERAAAQARSVIIDFRRVSQIDATGVRLLLLLARSLAAAGKSLLLAHITPETRHGRFVAAIGGARLFTGAACCADADAALERAEDALLAAYQQGDRGADEMALAELCLADGLWPEDVEVLATYLKRKTFAAGDILFREGDAGSALFLLARGTVTIRLNRAGGGQIRLATLIPGVMFGEMALLEGQPRSAEAIAQTDIVAYEMDEAAFSRILTDHPKLAARLMANMAREIAARLRTTSEQLRAMS